MWCYHIQLAHVILGEKMTSVRLADFMHKKLFVLAVPSGSPQNVAPLLWQKLLGGCHDNGQVQQSLMDNLVTDVEMGPKWAEIHQAQHHAAAQLWAASSVRFFCLLEQSQFKWVPGWDELFTLHIMCVWADLIHGSWRHFCPRTMLCRRIRSNPSAGSYQSQVHWGW